jgi:DNA-binding MarR family transcriptional regulator
MDWDSVSFVMSGKLRFRVLVELKDSQKTPSDLKENIGSPISHISKTLKELESEGLAECLTPERRKMKFFRITNKGIEILDEINKLTSKIA